MKLFHFPQACSRVALTALEEAGFEYEDQVINILEAEQQSPEYLAIHRSGKVPALQVGEQVITENPSIIYYLHRQAPSAHLLPEVGTEVEQAQQVSDLVWCSSTVHPTMRQVRMPIRFTDGDPSGIQAKGHELLTGIAKHVNDRIGDGWWYADQWSIVDVYLTWIFTTGVLGGFELTEYPNIQALIDKIESKDSYRQALAREQAAWNAHKQKQKQKQEQEQQ
ncbi:MAG: glutathione S-transferase family protein [Pseudomonadota bacterium]